MHPYTIRSKILKQLPLPSEKLMVMKEDGERIHNHALYPIHHLFSIQ